MKYILVWSKWKHIAGQSYPAFGVTLDTLGKLWTAGSFATIMNLSDHLLGIDDEKHANDNCRSQVKYFTFQIQGQGHALGQNEWLH